MIPSILPTLKPIPRIQATFGASLTRIFPADFVEFEPETPYTFWQVIAGQPENRLSCPPNVDNFIVQFDVYGDSHNAKTALDAASDLRTTIEELGFVQLSNARFTRDPETRQYVVSFDVSWWEER